jgi:hypothetical protein
MWMPAALSVDGLLAVDPATLDARELKAHLIALGQARSRLDAAEAAAIGHFDARGLYGPEGMVNTRAWLGITRGCHGQSRGVECCWPSGCGGCR